MGYILYNDKIKSSEDVSINIEDRSYQFGDGIYEVIAIYNGHFFKLKEHLNRLEKSAKKLKINIPYTINTLVKQIRKLKKINNIENGTVYLQISRGVAKRTHHFPEITPIPVIIGYTQEREQPIFLQENGVDCILTEDIRWKRCDIKTVNLLGNVLAKQEAIEQGAYEALLHRNEIITEGASTNIFIIKNKQLFTHPVNNYILNGITRKTIIDLCNKNHLKVIEQPFNIEQLLDADEAFICSTFSDIIPIKKINNIKLGIMVPGNLTTKIQYYFRRLIDNQILESEK